MSRNYIDNQKFLQSLIDYRHKVAEAKNNGSNEPKIPNYVGECIMKIANNLARKGNFVNYTYKDDMVSDGIENAIKCLHNFDPEKSNNPFAYFTQVIYYAFLRRIQKEKKQLYVRHKVIENAMISGTIVDKKEDEKGGAAFIDLNTDYMNDFVKSFEDKLKENKIKKPKSKKGLEKFYGDEEQ